MNLFKKLYYIVSRSLLDGGNSGILYITIKNGSITKVKNHVCFQTRADSSLKMIIDALKLDQWEKKSKKIILDTNDFPRKNFGKNYYAYCASNKNNVNRLFPDFFFESWPQAGVSNYNLLIEEMERRGKDSFLFNKLLWIGNSLTHRNRSVFLEIAYNNKNLIDAYNTNIDKHMNGETDIPYISLPDHTKYKYLIDIEGNGFSARLSALLFTQRVVFIQERKWKQYYYYSLEPYVHYIPIKNDFSDLIDQITFVEQQGDEYYTRIALNALNFAKKNLKYENAIARVRNLIDNKYV